VPRLHYWTSESLDDFADTGPAPDPQGVFHTAQRSDVDTHTRSIHFPSMRTFVTVGTGKPPDGWWYGAFARLVIAWDPLGAVEPVDVDDVTQAFLGWIDLTPAFTLIDSGGDYVVDWRPVEPYLDIKGQRRGFGEGTFPNVNGWFWVGDHNGVFVGTYGSHVKSTLRITSRVLWSTDTPAGP